MLSSFRDLLFRYYGMWVCLKSDFKLFVGSYATDDDRDANQPPGPPALSHCFHGSLFRSLFLSPPST